MYRGVKGEQLRFQVFLASVDRGVGVDRRVLLIARATSSAEKLACQGQYSFRGQQHNGLKENTPWHPGHHLFVLAWFRSLDNRDPNIATRKRSSWRCDLPMRPKSTTRPKRTKQLL